MYTYTNARNVQYYLNATTVMHKDGTSHELYFFSLDERDSAVDLPEGKIVVESAKTGLPMVKNVA